MSLVIDDPDLERELRALAAKRGERVEDVLRQALSFVGEPEPAPRQRTSTSHASAAQPASEGPGDVPDWLTDLQARFRRNAVDLDSSDNALVGYDEDGLPS